MTPQCSVSAVWVASPNDTQWPPGMLHTLVRAILFQRTAGGCMAKQIINSFDTGRSASFFHLFCCILPYQRILVFVCIKGFSVLFFGKFTHWLKKQNENKTGGAPHNKNGNSLKIRTMTIRMSLLNGRPAGQPKIAGGRILNGKLWFVLTVGKIKLAYRVLYCQWGKLKLYIILCIACDLGPVR
jgi:hypothetical protein